MAAPADNQHNGVPQVHNHYGASYHLGFTGVAPHTVNFAGRDESNSLPMLQHQEKAPPPNTPQRPDRAPSFRPRRQGAFPFSPLRRDGAVYIGGEMVFDPPRDGRLIRVLLVDDEAHVHICDDELRRRVNREARELGIGNSTRTERDPFMKCALVLRWIDVSGQGPLLPCREHLETLRGTRSQLSARILEQILRLAGGPERLRLDDMPGGPDERCRLFIGYVLSYCTDQQLMVCVDEYGRVHPEGQLRVSNEHIIEMREDGIEFDFRYSFSDVKCTFFLRWHQFKPLPTLGMKFFPENLVDIPMAHWFTVEGRDVTDLENDSVSDDSDAASMELVVLEPNPTPAAPVSEADVEVVDLAA